jgi:hypothetical protein
VALTNWVKMTSSDHYYQMPPSNQINNGDSHSNISHQSSGYLKTARKSQIYRSCHPE